MKNIQEDLRKHLSTFCTEVEEQDPFYGRALGYKYSKEDGFNTGRILKIFPFKHGNTLIKVETYGSYSNSIGVIRLSITSVEDLKTFLKIFEELGYENR